MLMPPVDSWSDRSSIFKDVEGVRPAIDAICEQEGIGYRRIETPHGSHTNAVFILDRSLVLKIYNPVWPEFEMECRLIEVRSRNGAVPAPSIVASGQLLDRLSWSYLIQEFSSGLTLEAIRPEITREDLLGIASEVGAVVRALLLTDVRLFDDIDAGESWEALVDRRRREALPELTGAGVITPGVAEALADTLDEAIAGSSQTPHVIVHGDLESDHVLLERSGGEWAVASIIDFGDAKVGLRGCLQSLELVLNLMNEPQIVPQRPDGRTVGDPRPPTPTSQTRRPAPYSGPAGGSERHPVFASERMPLADGPARSASLADPVQILPQLDHGWNVGTSQ